MRQLNRFKRSELFPAGKSWILTLVFLVTGSLVYAQEPIFSKVFEEDKVDSVLLRREAFHGIGPVPYHLPPKKTRKQQIRDLYVEKYKQADSINRLIRENELLREMQTFGNPTPIPASYAFYFQGLDGKPDAEKNLIASIRFYENIENSELSSNFQAQLGLYYAQLRDYSRAMEQFAAALGVKERLNDRPSSQKLLLNMARLSRYQGKLAAEEGYLREMLKSALVTRDLSRQASAMAELAMLKASRKQFAEAQTDIIKKVLPLYKRAKDYDGRVEAYNQLASIYRQQEKYTQSRWFYLQAIEVAALGRAQSGMAYSLYALAKVKAEIEEYDLAIADYKAAAAYAEAIKNPILQLRILDGLGDLYYVTGAYEDAAATIQQYNEVKALIRYPSGSAPAYAHLF